MTAVVKTRPVAGRKGTDILTVPVPEPGQAEVLIKVLATAICGSDKHIYQWDPSMAGMVQPPRIYGHEFCGEIVAFGSGGKRPHLEIGQYVSAEMHVTCGHCRPCRTGQRHICENTRILGVHGDGCFAQYVVVPAYNVVPLDREVVPVRVGAFLDALGNAVHTTQVADLSGRAVAVLGYGPIGAMCAEIARISGASHIAITDVNAHAAAHARRWASQRGLTNVTVIDLTRTKDPAGTLRDATGGGADVVLELSGAEASVNLGLAGARRGGVLSLLGLPREKSLTIRDYTNDFIFKGLTLHAIIGRRVFETWIKMLDLLRAGLDVEHLVTNEFDGLDRFHEAMELL
ncbi:MAG: alcohol dehydrogenase catalytic domain-containing protein, partial [Acidobacteriota bacterium]